MMPYYAWESIEFTEWVYIALSGRKAGVIVLVGSGEEGGGYSVVL